MDSKILPCDQLSATRMATPRGWPPPPEAHYFGESKHGDQTKFPEPCLDNGDAETQTQKEDTKRRKYRHNNRVLKKEKVLKTRKYKKFDSTLGYPGEGPRCQCLSHQQVERTGLLPCRQIFCHLAPHYHQKGKASQGAKRRMQEKQSKKKCHPPAKTWECCEWMVASGCDSIHAHDKNPELHICDDALQAAGDESGLEADSLFGLMDAAQELKPLQATHISGVEDACTSSRAADVKPATLVCVDESDDDNDDYDQYGWGGGDSDGELKYPVAPPEPVAVAPLVTAVPSRDEEADWPAEDYELVPKRDQDCESETGGEVETFKIQPSAIDLAMRDENDNAYGDKMIYANFSKTHVDDETSYMRRFGWWILDELGLRSDERYVDGNCGVDVNLHGVAVTYRGTKRIGNYDVYDRNLKQEVVAQPFKEVYPHQFVGSVYLELVESAVRDPLLYRFRAYNKSGINPSVVSAVHRFIVGFGAYPQMTNQFRLLCTEMHIINQLVLHCMYLDSAIPGPAQHLNFSMGRSGEHQPGGPSTGKSQQTAR